MTSHLDVDGLQHFVHARCEKCGFELDLADRSEPRFSALDRLAIATTSLGLFGLVVVAASMEQFEKMLGDMGGELPTLTQLLLRFQLPLPFLAATVVAMGLGAWRKSRDQRGGRALLWLACAVGVVGAAVCLWALYGPVFALSGQIKDLEE
ncbi:MAG: hypothetical protein QM765_42395 [Myxococcales bacterium]